MWPLSNQIPTVCSPSNHWFKRLYLDDYNCMYIYIYNIYIYIYIKHRIYNWWILMCFVLFVFVFLPQWNGSDLAEDQLTGFVKSCWPHHKFAKPSNHGSFEEKCKFAYNWSWIWVQMQQMYTHVVLFAACTITLDVVSTVERVFSSLRWIFAPSLEEHRWCALMKWVHSEWSTVVTVVGTAQMTTASMAWWKPPRSSVANDAPNIVQLLVTWSNLGLTARCHVAVVLLSELVWTLENVAFFSWFKLI